MMLVKIHRHYTPEETWDIYVGIRYIFFTRWFLDKANLKSEDEVLRYIRSYISTKGVKIITT